MRRRSFFKVVLSGAGAAAWPWSVEICRWAHGYCAPFPPDQYFATECGTDFLVAEGTRESNGFMFCPYCGRRIVEIKLKTGELCGKEILYNLPRFPR